MKNGVYESPVISLETLKKMIDDGEDVVVQITSDIEERQIKEQCNHLGISKYITKAEAESIFCSMFIDSNKNLPDNEQNNIAQTFFTIAQKVYSYLNDDISKGIFTKLIGKYTTNFTGFALKDYVSDILKEKHRSFEDSISSLTKDEKLILWGAGVTGAYVLSQLQDKENIWICDKAYDSIQTFHGYTVYSPDEIIANHNDAKIILTSGLYMEMYPFLFQHGVKKENVLLGCVAESDKCYFDEVLSFTDSEIFVDVGAFGGETAVIFANKTNNKYKKIYMLEPDVNNIKRMDANEELQTLKNVERYTIGASDKKETLRFNSGRSGNCIVTEDGDVVIECNTLDSVLGDKEITFLKINTGGSELKALQGAKELISKQKPKLAIANYKPEDFIVLSSYIKTLVPEYKISFRHYSTIDSETVLYAVI